MQGVIYVAHGSQKSGKNQKMQHFYQELKSKRPEGQQALAFLENHPDNLSIVAERMANLGVTRLVIVPLLLFSAMHKNDDIPRQLAPVKKKFPALTSVICDTFGQEKEVRMVLFRAIRQALKEYQLDSPEVLLVAHGSSRYFTVGEIVKNIGCQFSKDTGLSVTTGLLYGQYAYLEKAEVLLETNDKLLVVPFFLFDGHLPDKIRKELATLIEEKKFTSQIFYTSTLNLDLGMTSAILRLMDQRLTYDD